MNDDDLVEYSAPADIHVGDTLILYETMPDGKTVEVDRILITNKEHNISEKGMVFTWDDLQGK